MSWGAGVCLWGQPSVPWLDPLQLERTRFEAGEALSALRRLQRRVLELEEESRLQDANMSSSSLQSELAHSLNSDQDQEQDASAGRDTQVSSWLQAGSPPVPWASSIKLYSSSHYENPHGIDQSFDPQITVSLETEEASSLRPSPQVDSLEPPKKRAPLSPAEILEEKETEVAKLQDEVWEGYSTPPAVLISFPSSLPSLCLISPVIPIPGFLTLQ